MFKNDSPLARLQAAVLTRAQVRSVDQLAVEHFHINSLVLMENAGLECTKWLEAKFSNQPRTLIMCGHGNNGGDGFVIHRHLQAKGWPCRTIVSTAVDSLSRDARVNAGICLVDDKASIIFEPDIRTVEEWLGDAELILDAMLGTGATGEPREPFATWIDLANRSTGVRVAIDSPTGVDVETGERSNRWFQAEYTLTFVARKPAMILSEAARLFGSVHVLPIGIPRALATRFA